MLRRLFPLLVTIASYLPERHQVRWGRERDHQLRGRLDVLKLKKPVSLTCRLHVRLENRIVLRALGLFKKFFLAESGPRMQFGSN